MTDIGPAIVTNWRAFVPAVEEVPRAPELRESGYPEVLVWADCASVANSPEWAACLAWFNAFDQHVVTRTGLAMWGGDHAARSLAVLSKRFFCWLGLPVPRGMRVNPVRCVEARDLRDDDAFDEAREAGMLLVLGVGAVSFNVDRSIEMLTDLASVRSRGGGLTLWHLEPSTDRSLRICDALLRQLGASVIVAGSRPTT